MPTIYLAGDPHGWTTNQRPRAGPVRAAAAEAWRRVGPYRSAEAHLTAQFRFLWTTGGRPPDTDSVSWAAKVGLDAAVDAGVIPDDSGAVISSVTLLAPARVEERPGLLLTLAEAAGLGPVDVVGVLPESGLGRRRPQVHGTRHAYQKRGCRCSDCEAWHEGRLRKRREAKARARERRRRERLATGTHGTAQMVRDGCNCGTCGEYVAQGTKLERSRFAVRQRLEVGELAHGTASAYQKARCRCRECWAWYQANVYRAKSAGYGPRA